MAELRFVRVLHLLAPSFLLQGPFSLLHCFSECSIESPATQGLTLLWLRYRAWLKGKKKKKPRKKWDPDIQMLPKWPCAANSQLGHKCPKKNSLSLLSTGWLLSCFIPCSFSSCSLLPALLVCPCVCFCLSLSLSFSRLSWTNKYNLIKKKL